MLKSCHVTEYSVCNKYTKAKCFRCGLSVCVNCSSRKKYLHFENVRLCNDC